MTAVTVSGEKCTEDIYRSPFFFIKLEMGDGTSELLRVTEKQISELGIKIANPVTLEEPCNKTVANDNQDHEYAEKCPPDGDDANHAAGENPSNINYQIVRPEDLNLQRSTATQQLPKGRPKKRPIKKRDVVTESSTEKPAKLPKNIRTRSGRITKPPKHFEKDFKKIDLMETNVEGDIVAKEFEPLRTNEQEHNKHDGQTPLLQLQVHRKRRIMSGQYRCPTCNKAYLGQLRLIKHLQKNPDHGSANEGQKQHSSSWKFLIETALKAPIGSKAKAFCDELSMLVQNARILAKYLFKLSSEESAFQLDEMLANVLGVVPGKYTFNENDLCKDVTLFSYLDMNYFDETYLNGSSEKSDDYDEKSKTLFEKEKVEVNDKCPSEFNLEANTSNVVDFVSKTHDSFMEIHENKGVNEKEKASGYSHLMDQPAEKSKRTEKAEKPAFDLPNPLLAEDVEELILRGVDSSQNMLDTSTNSDDIMNVDQFVNERFKKLTEPEIDLSAAAALNLDLPSLELFQFHHT